jgi:hypothetical protein
MACPNINTKYFRNLKKDFGFDDAYRINYRTNKQKFDNWYKDGQRDKFGNPRINGNYFISGSGQKFLIANALKTTEEERNLWQLGARTEWKNPANTKTSELSKAQWVHVRTKAFKEWFGDWQNFTNESISKAINKVTGEPQVYYHQGNKVYSSEKSNTPVFIKSEKAIKDRVIVKEDENIKSAVSNNGEYTVGINDINKSRLEGGVKETIDTVEDKSELLKNKFAAIGIDVTVVEDDTLEENANVRLVDGNPVITINPNKVYADTIPHEFSHLYVDLLGYSHPLVKAGIKQLKERSPKLWNIIQKKYAEDNLTQEQLEKELLVTAMGTEGAALMEDNPTGIAPWKATVARIFREIGKILGIKPNIAKQLFTDIMANEFRINEFRGQLEKGVQKSKLNDIAETSSYVTLNDSDPKNTFYKNTKTNSILSRLTDFISGDKSPFSFVKNGQVINYERIRAENAFLRHGKDKKTETVEYVIENKRKIFTFDELVAFYKIKNTTSTAAGSVAHAMIEKFIKIFNNQPTMDIDKRINELSKEKPGEQDNIPESWFSWLDSPTLTKIFGRLGINSFDENIDLNDRDKIQAEVILHSDLLGIATTADTIVEHNDGSISMIDWKAGNHFLTDFADTSRILKYSGNNYINIYDNKVGRAQLELMMRAMIIKEHHPDTKFRNLTVAHLQKIKEVEGFEVNINDTLSILEKYYKIEKPDVYKQLKEKGVFNARSYVGMDMDMKFDADMEGKSNSDKIAIYTNRLQALTTSYPKNKHNDDEIVDLTKKILILEKNPGDSLDFSMTGESDMGFIKRWLGSKTAVTNNIVQTFIKKIVEPAQNRAQEELDKANKEHRDLLIKVADEYFERKGLGKRSDKWMADNFKSFFVKYNDMYSFMWEYMDTPGKTGWYARTDMDSLIKDNRTPEGRQMTEAEKEYSIWYRAKIAEMYEETMSRIGNAEGDPIWKILKKPAKADPNFMPRVPITIEEVAEIRTLIKNGAVVKEQLSDRTRRVTSSYWEYIKSNKLTTFTEDLYRENEGNAGLPVKYVADSKIIESQNHTMNTEIIFENFASNMIMKKNLDPAYAVGQGVIGYFNSSQLLDPESGETKFPMMTKWLEDQLKIQLQTIKGKEEFARKGIKIPSGGWKIERNSKTKTGLAIVPVNPGKFKKINIFGFMKGMKSFVSASTLWLKPYAGAANGALITIFNAKAAIRNSIASRIWDVDDSSIDFTFTDLVFAHKEMGKHWAKTFAGGAGGLVTGATAGFFTAGPLGAIAGAAIGGAVSGAIGAMTSNDATSINKDKLTLLMKKYRFLPDNYDFAVNNSELITGKNKPIDQGHMYLFHSIPEEYGQQVLLIAMMKRMGVWDKYDVNSKGELEWTGGVRFKRITSDGEVIEVKGLTPEEINRMKYVSARIHGGYRTEEKTALELNAFGQWALQFKKYLPAIIIDSAQGKFEDMSIGKFAKSLKQQEGQDVYEWVSTANRGRMGAFGAWLMVIAGMRDGTYKEYMETLSIEEKKQITDFFVSMGSWIMLFLAIPMAFDDDDDEIWGIKASNAAKDRYEKLAQDMTQGWNPADWGKALEKPFPTIPKFYNVGTGLLDMFTKGLLKGERVTTGRYKGNMPGSAAVRHNLPIFATMWEIERFAESRN